MAATKNDELFSKVGVSSQFQDPTAAVTAAEGTYADPAEKVSDDEKLAIKQMPRGPEKSPFKVGGL